MEKQFNEEARALAGQVAAKIRWYRQQQSHPDASIYDLLYREFLSLIAERNRLLAERKSTSKVEGE